MTDNAAGGLTPEQKARRDIDAQLAACGWVVQDHKHAAVAAARGVAVREVPVGQGRADYVLFVECQAVGVIEAKPVGTTLTGVERQTLGYRQSYPGELPAFGVGGVLPFGYESTGVETRFTCGLDPLPTSRRVFAFHRPETLARWVEDRIETEIGTLRAGLELLPDLDPRGLWPAQAEAIRSLEASLRKNRPRALIKMATGSGKTFTAVNATYRLVRHAGAQRILFLVDRANLGRQAVREFEGFDTPDDGRKFTELYNVRRLTASHLDVAAEGATKVHVSTIQRLYSLLRGEALEDDLDEQSGFEMAPEQPVEVVYNPAVPIESYDMIIVDECHRSIYGVWRQVLEYFDAFLVGLTATPGIQTAAFFEQNLVTDYGHAEAVADRVNVDFDVFRIRTEITEGGGTVPAGFVTEFRHRLTRSQRIDRVDEDVDYDAAELGSAPRAWDHLFQHRRRGWVRCRLKSGTWLGGAFAEVNGRQSVVARYPEPQDLYLAATIDVDPRTGELRGDWQAAAHDDIGVLLRWEDIEYLEFIHADERTETDVGTDQEGIGMAIRARRTEAGRLRGHRRDDADQ